LASSRLPYQNEISSELNLGIWRNIWQEINSEIEKFYPGKKIQAEKN